MKHLLAVYGTLRQGHGNNRLLENSNLLGIQKVPGFKMYSLGGFPAINKADDDSSIEIEVYEVTSPNELKNIYRLEGYTGNRDADGNWYDTTDVKTEFGDAEIFYFKGSLEGTRPLVADGVWK